MMNPKIPLSQNVLVPELPEGFKEKKVGRRALFLPFDELRDRIQFT
jgi:hypothetical protein